MTLAQIISDLATPANAAAYAAATDKYLFAESLLNERGVELSATKRPRQAAAIVGLLETALEKA